MIRPSNFGFNVETFESNSFQNKPSDQELNQLQSLAQNEFNKVVSELRNFKVNVLVYNDFPKSTTPDSIFPNNWLVTHESGRLFTFPMMVENRRKERRSDIVKDLSLAYGYKHIDLSEAENAIPPEILEGTGSMIFDHHSKKIYVALSPRTCLSQVERFASEIDYSIVAFKAFGKQGEAIYHTNVMLAIGEDFAVLGSDTIDVNNRNRVIESLKKDQKELILLSNDQVYNHFAGNMLQVKNAENERLIVMSEQAYQNLTANQIDLLEKHNDHLIHVDIPTIERIGGGSIRCMLAEIMVPVKS